MPGTPQRRSRKRVWYSDDDRSFALRWLEANDGNVSRTARELDIPIPTLHQWARGTRMSGMIEASRRRPLAGLWHFRSRALPVFCLGQPILVDVTKLTLRQHAQLLSLLELARIAPPGPETLSPPVAPDTCGSESRNLFGTGAPAAGTIANAIR